jgi:hypothetical protein
VLELTQTYPRAGLAVIAECFVWGSGWFAWKAWGRGAVMILFWLVVIAVGGALQPIVLGFGLFFPPIPAIALLVGLMIYFAIGLSSARALLQMVEKEIATAPLPAEGQA